MENIIRRYTLDEVFEVIDKHIMYHDMIIEDSKRCLVPDMLEIHDSCCAIACLKMLKNELEGKVEY